MRHKLLINLKNDDNRFTLSDIENKKCSVLAKLVRQYEQNNLMEQQNKLKVI